MLNFRKFEGALAGVLFFILGLCLFCSNYSIWGGDGNLVWLPTIQEYLRGTEQYLNSPRFFQGQNLMSIHGYIPIWWFFRLIGLNAIQVLNLTYFIWLLLAFFPLRTILIKLSKESYPSLISFFYILFSPIILNRVYAGHPMYIFALLPLLYAFAITLEQKPLIIAFAVISSWFATSIQSYPVLLYSFFYLPLLYSFNKEHGKESLRKVFIILGGVTVIALVFSIPTLKEMFLYLKSGSNLRAVTPNVVYSYITTELKGLLLLIFSSQNTAVVSIGKFHELSYPLGLFVFFPFFLEIPKRVRVQLCLLFVILITFSMDLLPGNLLSHIFPFKLFRVPQRSLMFFSFFVPIYAFSLMKRKPNTRILGFTLVAFLTCLLLPQLEYILYPAIILITLFGYRRKKKLSGYFVLMAFLLIFSGTMEKLKVIARETSAFKKINRELLHFKQKNNGGDILTVPLSFQIPSRVYYDAVWKYMGGITFEGYGVPPQKTLKRISEVSGEDLNPLTNSAFLPDNDEMLLKYGYEKKVVRNSKNQLIVEKVSND